MMAWGGGSIGGEAAMRDGDQEAQGFDLKISAGGDASADQLDDLTRQLFSELGELEVESVT